MNILHGVRKRYGGVLQRNIQHMALQDAGSSLSHISAMKRKRKRKWEFLSFLSLKMQHHYTPLIILHLHISGKLVWGSLEFTGSSLTSHPWFWFESWSWSWSLVRNRGGLALWIFGLIHELSLRAHTALSELVPSLFSGNCQLWAGSDCTAHSPLI